MNDVQATRAVDGDAPWWSDGPIDDEGVDGPWRWRGGWQRWVFPSLWLVYLLQTVAGVADRQHGVALVVGMAIVAAFSVVYVVAQPFGARKPNTGRAVLIMSMLTAAELWFAHEDALTMCVFIAVLIVTGGTRRAWLWIALLTAASVAAPAAVRSWHTAADWDMLITLPLVAFAMYGFHTVITSARALAAARAEVVRLAAENERSRIARDLHDLLGHSLTTITVKAALAKRLATRDPDRAAREIGEVEELSRSTLADVRSAVAGYREVTLAGELATAGHVLRSAGIDPHLPRAVDDVPAEHRELFGWVVREGVTNVVRHARAANCVISVGPTWVQVEDDGRGSPLRTGGASGGTGLRGLEERAGATGGTVRSGPGGAGWVLRVDVPAVHA